MTDRLVVAHLVPFYRAIEGDVVAGQLSLAYRWRDLAPETWFLKSMTMQGSPVMHTRNLLTAWALADQGEIDPARRADEFGPPADILLWQDADVVATVEELVKLVHALVAAPADVGAIAAPCVSGSAGRVSHNVNFVDHPEAEPAMHAGAIVECSLAGFGLIATRAAVYEAIGFPWFLWGYRGGLEHVIGEDMGWCEKARLAGYAIFAHGGIRPGHVFPREYRLNDDLVPWLVASQPKER